LVRRFVGGEVSFWGAKFSGGTVNFYGAKVSDGMVTFDERGLWRARQLAEATG